MSAPAKTKPLVYVADSHLTTGDREVDSFVSFLETVGMSAGTLYILGDLFNVWFGEPKFRMPHQQRVLSALSEVASSGVVLKFVEGNRDFSVRRNHLGDPFADVGVDHLIEDYGNHRIFAAHGDEVNREDRQYRLWKRVSKSGLVYGTFRLLPGSWGILLGESLERKLSGTNLRHKSRFPTEQCQAYAETLFREGCDTMVLGHFHEEMELTFNSGTVFVLPAWRGHHRYLKFEGTGSGRFVDFDR